MRFFELKCIRRLSTGQNRIFRSVGIAAPIV
jgi:hypothetical protein